MSAHVQPSLVNKFGFVQFIVRSSILFLEMINIIALPSLSSYFVATESRDSPTW